MTTGKVELVDNIPPLVPKGLADDAVPKGVSVRCAYNKTPPRGNPTF
jgi:hypothetical protein